MKRCEIFFIVDGARLEAQACLLAPTLRAHLNDTQTATAYVREDYVDQVDPLTREVLERSGVARQGWTDLEVNLGLSQAVPYRVFTLDAPARLVLDFREVDWSGFDPASFDPDGLFEGIRYGVFRPGWSRLVLTLPNPLAAQSVNLAVDQSLGQAQLRLVLAPTGLADFKAKAGVPSQAKWALRRPRVSSVPHPRQRGDRPLRVVIDPGHGGVDPGAKAAGHLEKTLVLTFARELQEALIRAGRFDPSLTRTQDRFVSLPERISIARARAADVLISLHADALTTGNARGATVYTLSEKASTQAAAQLARQHERDDLLAGVDLSAQDDEVASVLMDLARIETQTRSDLLAEMMVAGIAQKTGRLRKRPHLSAGFSVLRAPDIPSILIELGFMSNRDDLQNLITPEWRARVIEGIVLALDDWAVEDAAQARLLRK